MDRTRRSLPIVAATRSPASGTAASPALFDAAAPRFPAGHLFESGEAAHLFVADGSRIYDLDAAARAELEAALATDDGAFDAIVAHHAAGRAPYIDDTPL